MRSRPWSTSMRRMKTFSDDLCPPPPDPLTACDELPTVADQNWGGKLRCGGHATTPLAPYRAHPVTLVVGTAAVPAPPPPPPPLGRLQGLDPRPGNRVSIRPQPTRAPGRRDGPGSPPRQGTSPGGGNGPHATVGKWRYCRGHSRRGAVAPPRTGCDRDGGRQPPPPPPRGTKGSGGLTRGVHCLTGEQGVRGRTSYRHRRAHTQACRPWRPTRHRRWT